MTRLPTPPGFPVLLRQEFGTALVGLPLAWRVGVVVVLVAAGLFLGADPSRGFYLPAGPSPIAVDLPILVALVLAVVTWYPAAERSPFLWIGVRPLPVEPTHRFLARALAGSTWILLAGAVLLAITAFGPLITGHGSVGLPPGAIAALLSSMVVAYLFWSLCTVSGPWVAFPALAVAAGILWSLVQRDGSATTGGLGWWLLEGTFAPGAALVGANLPAAFLWGSLFLLLIPYAARHERHGKETAVGGLGRMVSGPASSGTAVAGRSMPAPSTFRLHLDPLFEAGAARVVVGYVLIAAIGGVLVLSGQGTEIWRPQTWGVALEVPFLVARGASVFLIAMLLLGLQRTFAPSTFRELGALPISRRRYLLFRGGAFLAVGLLAALTLHLIAAGWVLLAGEPMATAGYLASTLWMLVAVGMIGLAILAVTDRPLLLWIGLSVAAPILTIGLLLLAGPLHEATGGVFPEPAAYQGIIPSFRAADRVNAMGIALLLPLAGAAWYATGSRPLHRAN
ncbi:MAG: hypothetical protein EA351_05240 [Gemmatimonadales bacterium]|nr:MAG: hypothetical protein EA351_05240 [Gemmatimonadales bacterium]